jgi:hypothetical protein
MFETGPPGIAPPHRSHTSTEQWQSFEVRMRRRRAERCLLRADVALEAGFPADARDALDEAKRLGATPGETAGLEARIDAAMRPEPPTEPARSRWLLAPAVLGALVIGGGALWMMTASQAGPPPPSTPVTAAGMALPSPAAAPSDRVSVEQLVIDPASVVSAAPDAGMERPGSAPEAERTVSTDAKTAATPATPPPATPSLEPERAAAAPLPNEPERLAVAPPPVVHVPLAPLSEPAPVLPAANPVSVTREPAASTPVATTGTNPPTVDEAARVRDTLRRYEAAYSQLDAAAAHAVWPGVNQSALSRAFEGLAAQQLSLGRCDIAVTGPTARAHCAGSASWTPRVGGGGRTEPRQWTFELRNVSGAWQISRAITR